MIKKFIVSIALCLTLIFGGCATTPQNPLITQDVVNSIVDILEDYVDKNKPVPIPDPTPPPKPDPPKPDPPPVTPPPVTSELFMFDMDNVPGLMAQYGLGPASDNAFYYGLAFIARSGPDGVMPDDGAGSMVNLNNQRPQIQAWIDIQLNDIRSKLKANQGLKIVIIKNDGHDRLGCRLGPAIFSILDSEFPGRISHGTIYPEPGC